MARAAGALSSGPAFDRDARLRTRADIQAVFDGGAKLVNRQLVVWFLPGRPGGPSRLGLSVSRKVGGAVARNRVKRCLREAWRQCAPSLPASVDVMVLARPMAAPRDFAEAHSSLAHLLRKYASRSSPRPGPSSGSSSGPSPGPSPGSTSGPSPSGRRESSA